MNYFKHMGINLIVAYKALLLCIFHLIHAVIPFEFTSHEYWGLNLTKEK